MTATQFVFLSLTTFTSLISCSESTRDITDSELWTLVQQTTPYTYYKDISTRVESQGGPHDYIAVKFNNVATESFDTEGKLPVDEEFPTGSLIVKESYTDANSDLNIYAVMYKNAGDSRAIDDWVWAEYSATGEVVYSIDRKGASCVSCHSQSGHRDYSRIFELYP
jgi:hypothetical protein